jgi:uncharacterized protein YjiS (DUF1127 family)
MMDESVRHRDHRSSSLDRRGDGRHRAARLSGTAWASSVLTSDCVAQHGSPVWMSPDMPPVGRERHRAETRHIALLMAIRRIVAALRRWREHARSQQQSRAFDDRLLRDIGLRREDLGYEFPKPFRHWD